MPSRPRTNIQRVSYPFRLNSLTGASRDLRFPSSFSAPAQEALAKAHRAQRAAPCVARDGFSRGRRRSPHRYAPVLPSPARRAWCFSALLRPVSPHRPRPRLLSLSLLAGTYTLASARRAAWLTASTRSVRSAPPAARARAARVPHSARLLAQTALRRRRPAPAAALSGRFELPPELSRYPYLFPSARNRQRNLRRSIQIRAPDPIWVPISLYLTRRASPPSPSSSCASCRRSAAAPAAAAAAAAVSAVQIPLSGSVVTPVPYLDRRARGRCWREMPRSAQCARRVAGSAGFDPDRRAWPFSSICRVLSCACRGYLWRPGLR